MDISRMRSGYRIEAVGLAAVSRSPVYKEIIRNFRNYKKYERDRLNHIDSRKLIEALSNNSGIISMSNTEVRLKRIFYDAQLAACCVVFDQVPIKMGVIHQKDIASLLETITGDSALDLMGQVASELVDHLHKSDALRMVTILRHLGLLRQSPEAIRQISFGAGGGNKDIYTIHSVPKVSLAGNSILLSTEYRPPQHVVLVDNDESVAPYYKRENEQHSGKVLAIVSDAKEAIEQLSTGSPGRQIEKRNFVVGIRVDHRMIPSVPDFFDSLVAILDHHAELVISVGAGHVLEEFAGRIQLMQKLYDYLRGRQLNPVYLKLHGGRTPQEQRDSPAFGRSGYTTYEIIHCILDRKKLSGW